jgi:signal transduction histidine kinase
MGSNPDKSLKIGLNEYEIILEVKKDSESTIYAITFLDKTRERRRQEGSAVIIESVGHSLRSTINHCLANLKMLSLIGELNNNQIAYFENTREALNEALQVTDDLALMDRLSGQKGLFINDFLPGNVIRRVIDLLKQKTRQKRIEIRYQEQPTQFPITTDQSLFTQSMYDLLDFALERSRMGGIITIEEQIDQDGWIFTIKDASRGMAQSELDELTSSKEKSEINRGYHIAGRILSYLGANLTINNNLGYGCQFIVNFPQIEK